MNQRNAAALFHEYLLSENPQIRRNALTAVASARVVSCYKDVVRMAVCDSDALVRERAEEEIASSGSPIAGEYAAALREMMASGKSALDAYRLAGRIRARGPAVPLGIPVLTRLKLAARERLSKTGKIRWLAWQAFFGGIFGLAAVWLVLLAVTRVDELNTEVMGFLVLGSMFLPAPLILISGRWWRPIQTEADRLAAILIEFCVLAVLGAATAGFGMAIAKQPETSAPLTRPAVIVSLLCGILSFCAVRAGAAAAHGSVSQRTADRILQMLAGTAAGALVLTFAAAEIGHATDPLTSAVWLALAPILPGLAMAFARVDTDVYSRFAGRPVLGRLSRVVTLLLILILVVTMVSLLIPPRIQPLQRQAAAGAITVPIAHLPYFEPIVLDSKQLLQISVVDSRPGTGDLTVQLTLSATRRVLGSGGGEKALLINGMVDPGSYMVEVDRAKPAKMKGPNPDKLLALVTGRLAKGFRPLVPEAQDCTLHILMTPAR
jgi:hypothetical protein